MPRVPSLYPRASSFLWTCATTVAVCVSNIFAAPTPAIVSTATTGQAPFTVHVHGLNSTVGVGNEATAKYEWEFGDPNGQYNTLVGWNAAHVYNQPGAYTIKLKITNQAGEVATATRQVTINPATRSVIYVSPTGSDSNNGLSEAAPIKTVAKAATLFANNREIRFKRGGVFDMSATVNITQQNMIISAYGTGASPKWNYTVNAQYGKMIDFGTSAKDIIVENIQFDSPFAPNNQIIRAMHPHGNVITVRNCHFGKVSYAMNTDGSGVYGLLTQNNTAGVIGGYYIWAKGSDHVHLGNDVDGSVDEHNIRFGGANRVLIAHNDLTNTAKSTIWCMLGDHCYVGKNTLREGRFIAGPNFATSTPTERFKWVVFEDNQIINEGVILYSGAEEITFRNNVIKNNGGECFSIWGYYAQWNRTCKNIYIYNNTAFNESTSYGRFIKLGSGADHVVAANNLYCATNLNSTNGASNVKSDDPNLNTHSFYNNIWAIPGSGSHTHALSTGGLTSAGWNALSQTSDESFRDFAVNDIDPEFVPQFNATMGVPVIGVKEDFYGNPRPASGQWTVGAVENEPGTQDPVGGDVTGDGVIDSDDLLEVLNGWGACSSCAADIDNDGAVDVDDLIIVLNQWN